MNWFYAKDGQQIGPVDFSEIERLRAEGQLTDDTLVWQQGMANWVKLSTVSKEAAEKPVVEVPGSPPLIPTAPQSVTTATTTPSPDYGDWLCWGIIGILLPCAGLAVYIALIVLHVLEFSAVRKAIAAGRFPRRTIAKFIPPSSFSDWFAVAAFATRFSCICEIARDISNPSRTRFGWPSSPWF